MGDRFDDKIRKTKDRSLKSPGLPLGRQRSISPMTPVPSALIRKTNQPSQMFPVFVLGSTLSQDDRPHGHKSFPVRQEYIYPPLRLLESKKVYSMASIRMYPNGIARLFPLCVCENSLPFPVLNKFSIPHPTISPSLLGKTLAPFGMRRAEATRIVADSDTIPRIDDLVKSSQRLP